MDVSWLLFSGGWWNLPTLWLFTLNWIRILAICFSIPVTVVTSIDWSAVSRICFVGTSLLHWRKATYRICLPILGINCKHQDTKHCFRFTHASTASHHTFKREKSVRTFIESVCRHSGALPSFPYMAVTIIAVFVAWMRLCGLVKLCRSLQFGLRNSSVPNLAAQKDCVAAIKCGEPCRESVSPETQQRMQSYLSHLSVAMKEL